MKTVLLASCGSKMKKNGTTGLGQAKVEMPQVRGLTDNPLRRHRFEA